MVRAADGASVVEVNGTRLVCERQGDGPALLFLHGFALDRRMWQPQVDALAGGFTTVTYDLRGFGGSALPTGPYRHVDDAAALIDRLALERVIVVGHSIGGLYALELALARPERVAGVVLVCMSGLGEPGFPAEVTELFAAVRQALREHGVAAAHAIWRRAGWFAPALAQPAAAAALEPILAAYSGWHWSHDNPAGNLAPPVRGRLEELAVPTAILDGERDLAYNHAVAEILARRIPRASLTRLAGVGHMPSLEAPAEVNRAIEALAARVAEEER